MSFGGFCEDDDPPIAIARGDRLDPGPLPHGRRHDDPPDLIRERVVFVASAGNDGSCRPTWPASFENVIAVGALGPDGQAWFTQLRPVGRRLRSRRRHRQQRSSTSARRPATTARTSTVGRCWSGTSFSAPIVAAVDRMGVDVPRWREQVSDKPTPTTSGRPGHAAAWLLDRPGHYRYPWLGTVVNPH